jgi:hypothetical protein
VENAVYGREQGILEAPVVAMSTDEAQNRWIATHTAVYLFKPGATSPVRFDASSGLHLMGNPPEVYDGACPGGEVSVRVGGAVEPGISKIVGGAPGEVFVGYHGMPVVQGDCHAPGADSPEARHSGKVDWVRLASDDTIRVDFLDFVNAGMGMHFYENRGVRALLYDHFMRPGDLYAGFNHGVTYVSTTRYQPYLDWKAAQPAGASTWQGEWINGWMGDHLHLEVCSPDPCPDMTHPPGARFDDWYGLALDLDGNLWHAGLWSAGLIVYEPEPIQWWKSPRPANATGNPGKTAFAEAFGRQYPNGPPPVFVPRAADGSVSRISGEPVDLSAVTVAPDGRVFFGSEGKRGRPSYGLASWKRGESFTYHSTSALGFPDPSIRALAALPDGRIAVAHPAAGVAIWDPATNDVKRIRAGSGLPSDDVQSMELDLMVSPPTLHVATGAGAAALRILP